MLHPAGPASEVRGAKSIITDEDCSIAPSLLCQSLPQACLESPVALNPAIAHDLPLEVVVAAGPVEFEIAPVVFDILPRELRVLVVGDEDYKRRIRVKRLQSLEHNSRSPALAYLAPPFDRTKRGHLASYHS